MEFEDYVVARGPALLRFAYVLTGDADLAQDVVQTALMKVHRRWGRVVRADHPDAYVRKVVVNAHLDHRRRRGSSEIPAEVSDAMASAHADHADGVVARDAMWRALADLPPRQRAVLVLRFYEDYDDRAIAVVLGCADSTVRSLAFRGIAALRAGQPASTDVKGTAS